MRFFLWLAMMPLFAAQALAQAPGGPPPAVGVVTVEPATIVQTSEFVGRIQAVNRVALNARVTAFLEQRLFVEGTEVHQGDLLYKLESGPFEADVTQKEATVADDSARLANATIQLNRAQTLLGTPAGQRSNVDDAVQAQRSAAAQLAGAQGALRQSSINLDYTQIRAPIDGEISRTAITPGNVVSPSSGPLATIVSQDPMYVVFPVADRALTDLRSRYAAQGGLNAVQVRLKLPDGTPYDRVGKIDYVDPSVATSTDTILVRATIANPVRGTPESGRRVDRTLTDGMFVTVSVEGIQPIVALGIPRAAVMSDQSGNYVFVVGADNKVERRMVQLGQSTAATAIIAGGLKQGESVILEGLQRARPGLPVTPGPAAPRPLPPASASSPSASPASASPASASPAPASPASASQAPASPASASQAPASPASASPASASPASASPASASPASASPASASPASAPPPTATSPSAPPPSASSGTSGH
jgi:membrane fusion protein (multidrug efflux system)